MYSNQQPYQRGFLSNIPSGVKCLLAANIIIFILQNLFAGGQAIYFSRFHEWFSLQFGRVVYELKIWQLFTYMFLHGNFMHLLFNMLGLFMLGVPIETYWGTKRFIYYYLFSGFIAGLLIFVIDFTKFLLLNTGAGSTVGASGAVFGLLLAYGLYYPDRRVLVFFIFPVKIKDFILWSIALSIIFIPMGVLSFISHTGHLGGILGGYLYHRFHKNDYHFNTGNSTLDLFFSEVKSKLGIRSSNVYSIKRQGFFSKIKNFFSSKFKSKSRNLSKSTLLDETKMTDYEIETKIDELLDIISSKGLRGLSMEEQLFLDRVSRLYKHKFPR